MGVGLTIRRLRTAAGMTQAELAALVDLTQPSIAMLENGSGSRLAGLELAAKLAAALGVTVDDLVQPTETDDAAAAEPA